MCSVFSEPFPEAERGGSEPEVTGSGVGEENWESELPSGVKGSGQKLLGESVEERQEKRSNFHHKGSRNECCSVDVCAGKGVPFHLGDRRRFGS